MIDALERVVLVDRDDRELGTAPKLAAHREGRLHRALSVILVDGLGRLLLQKRHVGKYHSGGLWTNACCSHPRPGEGILEAAQRRLLEEMGIACPLAPLFSVPYRAELDKGMTEHEVVHVFGGRYAGPVRPDPAEAEGFDWVEPEALLRDLDASPERYSVWFRKYCREYWGRLGAGLLTRSEDHRRA
jgi:isopentenyl-diphosphate delta-isomerase